MKRISAGVIFALILTSGLGPTAAQAVDGFSFVNGGQQVIFDSKLCRSGAGTTVSPWLIEDSDDLKQVGQCGLQDWNPYTNEYETSQNQPQHYRLLNDLSLSGDWKPINLKASGVNENVAAFDGNNKKISGLKINTDSSTAFFNRFQDNTGFFGETFFATIKNLTLEVGTSLFGSIWGGNDVGALVGKGSDTTIDGIRVTFPADAAITAIQGVGGIAGELRDGSLLKNSVVEGLGDTWHPASVNGYKNIGGVVGNLDSSSIINVANFGIHTFADEQYNRNGEQSIKTTGGLIGRFLPYADAELSGLFSNTTVIGESSGGLIGQIINDQSSRHWVKIHNSGVRGIVWGTNTGAYIGTLSEVTGIEFKNNYSTAKFTHDGSNFVTSEMVASFNSANPSYIDNIYESGGPGGVNNASLRTLITTEQDIPSSWSLVRAENNYVVDASAAKWVMVPSAAFNDGRPIPAALYNLGFFGAVVTAPAPSSQSGSSSSSGNSTGGGTTHEPASQQVPKFTKASSSFFRVGNKLRVTCSSPEAMRILINGKTVRRADAMTEFKATFTLSKGSSTVVFASGKTVVRRAVFKVK